MDVNTKSSIERSAVLLFFLFIVMPCTITPQAYSLKFSFYGPRQGLAGNQVNTVVQGKSGYMWFGTESGLSLFDGYEFKTIDKKNIIPDNRILSLCCGEDGSLWAGTQSGISKVHSDSVRNRIFYFYSDNGINKPLDSVRVIIEDKCGGIWAGTGESLVLFNEDRQRFEKIDIGEIGAPGVFSIVEGEGAYLWISAGSELIRYDVETREIYKIKCSELIGMEGRETFILSLHASRDGKLWIGSNIG